VKDPKILVFVSFSMPKASLIALSKDAEKYGAVLIMRGLKGDSFKETQTAFQALGEEERSGIEINPELFETYKIQQVPVFIKVKTAPEGDLQEIGRLSGNVSLAFAAQKLQEMA
jgi:conjugal transfer pilus assembly protein TrbC